MANYNIKRLYNNRINYNSSADYIIVMSDGASSKALVIIDVNANIVDMGIGKEILGIASNVLLEDSGSANDSINLMSNVYTSDFGVGIDILKSLFNDVAINDIVKGIDGISLNPVVMNFNDSGVGVDAVSPKSVANYNSRKTYNKKWDAGGASYNSYKHHIVMVEDFGTSSDALNLFFGDLNLTDKIITKDNISILPVDVSLSDKAISNDVMMLVSNIYTSDFGDISDSLGLLLEFPASEYLVVTTHDILEPLGVKVTNDSRHELMPSTRDSSEEIPGMHGEIDFGTELKARMLELSVVTNNGYTSLEKSDLQRLFAMYLNPLKGPKKLVFSDDIDKCYLVKYSGKIDPTNHPTWFQFAIPFKMSDPFIYGTFDKSLVGNGNLINSGTYETGLIIEIQGPATNPTLTIGAEIITYSGTILGGQSLVINTGKGTVKIGPVNAMADYNGALPLLYPGETPVAAPGNVTIRWKDKWI